MAAINAVQVTKGVADPLAAYDSMKPLWTKNRAVCSGERFVKTLDALIDVRNYTNLLIPFSPSMTQEQYNFYKAEAEFPGITSQFAKMLVGGLLRKQPVLKLPESAPKGAYQWIMDEFGQDNSPLVSFLDKALWEEMPTARCWLFVDYPKLTEAQLDNMTKEELQALKPYANIMQAESIISWKFSTNEFGVKQLDRLIIRGFEESFAKNEFHADLIATVWVHEIKDGKYQIRTFQKQDPETSVAVVNGATQQNYKNNTSEQFVLVDTNQNILIHGERMTVIPAWPLNGSVDIVEPMLTPIIDREVSLYNKISRRNHLLYGAATYTPVISTNMSDDEFDTVVESGLGTWLKLSQGDTADILATPTDALSDMDRAIASSIEEIAKLGLRMLSPESAQSGVALEIRNASQTAQLGTFNIKVSTQMADLIAFMLNWRYETEFKSTDIEFSLSNDFESISMDYNWLRLVTEWYQNSLIPRSIWLQILKENDILSPDYDDKEGKLEINSDEIIAKINSIDDANFANKMKQE